VLSDAEIRAVWHAGGSLGPFGRCVRFMLANGQRRTECGSMSWVEADRSARLWRLPAGRVKADRAHEVPLNDLALECLGEPGGGDPFVFGGSKPIGSWSAPTAQLRGLVAEQLPDAAPHWSLHDLRRTFATGLARLGIDRIVISRILNHADSGVTARYDRYGRDVEMVEAMDRWDCRLREIIEGRSAEVVELRGRRP